MVEAIELHENIKNDIALERIKENPDIKLIANMNYQLTTIQKTLISYRYSKVDLFQVEDTNKPTINITLTPQTIDMKKE